MLAIHIYQYGLTREQFRSLTPSQSYALARQHEQQVRQDDYRAATIVSKIHATVSKKPLDAESVFISTRLEKDMRKPGSAGHKTGNQLLSHMRLVLYNKPVNLKEEKIVRQVKKNE